MIATFPGWVIRSWEPLMTALSIRFLTISYRMSYAPSTSKRFSSKRKRIESGACWTSTRCVTSSGTGSFSLRRLTRSATPQVTMSCQSLRLLR